MLSRSTPRSLSQPAPKAPDYAPAFQRLPTGDTSRPASPDPCCRLSPDIASPPWQHRLRPPAGRYKLRPPAARPLLFHPRKLWRLLAAVGDSQGSERYRLWKLILPQWSRRCLQPHTLWRRFDPAAAKNSLYRRPQSPSL